MSRSEFVPVFKSCFAERIQAFLTSKRAIGYQYKSEAHILVRINRYFSERNIIEITEETISEWIAKHEGESDKTHGIRVTVLRQFCLFLNRDGVVAALPMPTKSVGFSKSFTPYIFTKDQINQILLAADTMPSRRNADNIRKVMPAILRLLYCCGLRVNEATSLCIDNIDWERKTITILHSKNDNCRIVPMTESLSQMLNNYIDKMYVSPKSDDFVFPSPKSDAYGNYAIYSAFREILWSVGISHGGRGKGPRLHDIRHTFAVHSLQKLILEGRDIYQLLPIISTYLGYKNIYATERYLRLTSEMYPDILEKVERSLGKLVPEVTDYET